MHTSIAIDKATKERAAKRAQADNMPLAAVVRVLLIDYADGRLSIGARAESAVTGERIPVDKATQKKMDTVVSEWHARIDT